MSAHSPLLSQTLLLLLSLLLFASTGFHARAAEPKDYRKPLPRTPAPGVVLPSDLPTSVTVVAPAPPQTTVAPAPVVVATPPVPISTPTPVAVPTPAPSPSSFTSTGVTPVANRAAQPVAVAAATSTRPTDAHPIDYYVIAPNDVLWMKVYQEDDLESKPKVGRDGTINLPLLGTVSVGGLTLEQAREKIRADLDRRFIVNPQVSLTVSEYSKRKFVVLGQVQRTGIYEYSGEEKMTLLQAIGMAGGYTRLAAPSRVTIQRQENGSSKVIRVDAEGVSKAANGAPFEILPDDTITVGTRVF